MSRASSAAGNMINTHTFFFQTEQSCTLPACPEIAINSAPQMEQGDRCACVCLHEILRHSKLSLCLNELRSIVSDCRQKSPGCDKELNKISSFSFRHIQMFDVFFFPFLFLLRKDNKGNTSSGWFSVACYSE